MSINYNLQTMLATFSSAISHRQAYALWPMSTHSSTANRYNNVIK